jgi:hypothetical protein
MRVAVRGKNLDLERTRRREQSCVAMRDARTVLLHAGCEDVSASPRILVPFASLFEISLDTNDRSVLQRDETGKVGKELLNRKA